MEKKYSLLKHFFKLGGGNFIKMLTGFVYIKILSSYLSPEEFGSLGQLLTFIAIVSMLSLGGTNNGIVKCLSSTKTIEKEWEFNLNKSFSLYVVISVVIFLLLQFFAIKISNLIIGNDSYSGIIRYFSLIQLCSSFGIFSSVFFISEINTKDNSLQTIANSLLFLLLVLIGMYFCSKKSLVYTAICINFFSGVYGLIYFWRKIRLGVVQSFRLVKIDFSFLNSISGYALVTISGAVLWPLSQLYLRDRIGADIGWDIVGYWFASVKISDAYNQFFSVLLLGYLYPKLSFANKKENKIDELINFAKYYIPLVLFSGLTVFICSHMVVWLLLGAEFKSAESYIKLQIIGDILKLLYSMLLIYILSCGKVKYSVVVELVNSILYVAATIIFVQYFNWRAPLIGYILTQGMTFIYVAFSFSRVIRI